MVKATVTNKGAAGLRRSAIAERLRLREEWSSLKGTDDDEPAAKIRKRPVKVFIKNSHNIKETNKISKNVNLIDSSSRRNMENTRFHSSSDPLRGVVALVDVGVEGRALPLRAALTALGATVVSSWGLLVTHLVWSQGGCRDTRAKARALACKVVSPLWVEACASSARMISEKIFPSTARDSDLPSPATLCRLLKTAEKENWQLPAILGSEDDSQQIRLRISSDLEEDSRNKNNGRTKTKDSVDIEHRVNTAPRRALPISMSPPPANPKSKRRLFTARADGEDDSDAENTPALIRKAKTRPDKEPINNKAPKQQKERIRVRKAPERQKKVKKYNLTQEQRRNLENAGRLAKKLAGNPEKRVGGTQTQQRRQEGTQTQQRRPEGTQTQQRKIAGTQMQRRRISNVPRIVLSGMPKSQYRAVFTAIQTLKGIVQKQVNRHTTHVLLGTCKEDPRPDQNIDAQAKETTHTPKKTNLSTNKTVKPFSICNQCNSPEGIVMKMFECDNVEVTDHCSNPANASKDMTVICSTVNMKSNVNEENVINFCDDGNNITDECYGIINDKSLRTLKTLLGAARGCRVLHAQWALDSLKEKSWVPHIGYEVTHLLKIAERARVERSAIGKMHSEYGYNVFTGMRVRVTETAVQRDAAVQLLTLCGALIVEEGDAHDANKQNNAVNAQNVEPTQNGGRTQNGGIVQHGDEFSETVVVGTGEEEVCSKWVFDSVAAGRPRTTRRYVNKNNVPQVDVVNPVA